MFPSKSRPIIIPQFEHGKLAGMLAAHWGNEQFAPPPIDFKSFVAAVTLHDWNYRLLDNAPLLTMAEEQRVTLFRKGVEHRFDNPTIDIVVQLHLRRLLTWWGAPQAQSLIAAIDERVTARLLETAFTAAQFQQTDTLTCFCDLVAFDFSFGSTRQRSYKVYSGARGEIELTYWIEPDRPIVIDPWPFSVPGFSGLLVAYQREGYPDTLSPTVLNYSIQPR